MTQKKNKPVGEPHLQALDVRKELTGALKVIHRIDLDFNSIIDYDDRLEVMSTVAVALNLLKAAHLTLLSADTICEKWAVPF